MTIRRWSLPALVVAMAPLAGGCAAPPDLAPFASSTREIALAVRAAGEMTLQVLQREHSDAAVPLSDAWRARNHTMQALVRYADNLVAITAAKADASTFVESIEQLALATGLLGSGGPSATGIATDAARLVAAQIDRARAAATLSHAMLKAQPVIDAVVTYLGAHGDLGDIKMLLDAVDSNIATAHLAATIATHDYVETLWARRAALLPDIQAGDEIAAHECFELTQSLELARTTIAALSVPFERRAAHVATARELIIALETAMHAWAAAHAECANALSKRQPVTMQSLIDTTAEIRSLVERMPAK